MARTRANIGQLIVSVVANVGPFQKGIKSVLGEMTKFKGAMAPFAKGGAILAGIGAAVVAFRSLGRAIGEARREIDALAKFSRRIGEDIGRLGGLQFAGQLTGAPIAAVNTGLQRMVRRVSEAAAGLGEARQALRELGLDAEQLNRLSPSRQFSAIADALANVNSEADQLRLTVKIFDTEGAALLPLLKEGSGGIKEMTDDFKNLGGVIRDDTVKAVEDWNDAMTRMRTANQGFIRILFDSAYIRGYVQSLNQAATVTGGISNYLQTLQQGTQQGSLIRMGRGRTLVPAPPEGRRMVERAEAPITAARAFGPLLERARQQAPGVLGRGRDVLNRVLDSQLKVNTMLGEAMREQAMPGGEIRDAVDGMIEAFNFRARGGERAAYRRLRFGVDPEVRRRIDLIDQGGLQALARDRTGEGLQRPLNKAIQKGTIEAFRAERNNPQNIQKEQLNELKAIRRAVDIDVQRINLQVGGLA